MGEWGGGRGVGSEKAKVFIPLKRGEYLLPKTYRSFPGGETFVIFNTFRPFKTFKIFNKLKTECKKEHLR
jgi:hypothetical protein